MKDKNNKCIAILIGLLIVLVIDLVMGVYHISNYEAQKAAGNERWRQVEQRIVDMEKQVHTFKIKLNQLEETNR